MYPKHVVSPRSGRGFTLVELLVVIGIIALLLGILMPVLGRSREAGRRVACLSNVRQLSIAMISYTADNKGYFPAGAGRGGGPPQRLWDWVWWKPSAVHPADVTRSALAKYVGPNAMAAALKCPSDDGPRSNTYPGDPVYEYSYTLNLFLSGYQYGLSRTSNMYEVKNGATKILIVEEDERSLNDGGFWPPGDWLAIRHDRARVVPDTFQAANLTRQGNASFCDGHAEWITREYAHDPVNYWPDK